MFRNHDQPVWHLFEPALNTFSGLPDNSFDYILFSGLTLLFHGQVGAALPSSNKKNLPSRSLASFDGMKSFSNRRWADR